MLTRIAQGLFELGAQVERSQHVTRVLEVNHKMNLERAVSHDGNVWAAISESFECGLERPDEAALYEALVLSATNPYSVIHCVSRARDEGRAMREHISEEMWIHLNRKYLELKPLRFESILRMGRSEFNRQIEVFGDALFGLADDTMVRGESWAFLRIGRFAERASMICRILDIKRKSLELSPELEGAPIDLHQWQALLRSLSGYEPYRRAHDARILPERVLEFVLQRPDFPRSLAFTLGELHQAMQHVAGANRLQLKLQLDLERFLEELRLLDPLELMAAGSIESLLRHLSTRCAQLRDYLAVAYFTSLRPLPAPITAAPGASLVPQ